MSTALDTPGTVRLRRPAGDRRVLPCGGLPYGPRLRETASQRPAAVRTARGRHGPVSWPPGPGQRRRGGRHARFLRGPAPACTNFAWGQVCGDGITPSAVLLRAGRACCGSAPRSPQGRCARPGSVPLFSCCPRRSGRKMPDARAADAALHGGAQPVLWEKSRGKGGASLPGNSKYPVRQI